VSNAVGEVTNRLREDYITVKVATTYVATNGGHQYPYASWNTAATSFPDAVAAAVSNVWVSNGNYTVTAQTTLDTG